MWLQVIFLAHLISGVELISVSPWRFDTEYDCLMNLSGQPTVLIPYKVEKAGCVFLPEEESA